MLRERWSDDGVVGQMPKTGKSLLVSSIVVGRQNGVERVVIIGLRKCPAGGGSWKGLGGSG